jgi:hypothetical protein
LLTDKFVMNLKLPRNGGRFMVQDIAVPGLAVRITPNGHRSYILGARFPGSPPAPRPTEGWPPKIT